MSFVVGYAGVADAVVAVFAVPPVALELELLPAAALAVDALVFGVVRGFAFRMG